MHNSADAGVGYGRPRTDAGQPDGSWEMQPRIKEEVVARIAQGQPDLQPDSKTQPSNAGYHLLGDIAEKAGGKPYQ